MKRKIVSIWLACFIVFMTPSQSRMSSPVIQAATRTTYDPKPLVLRALWRPHKNQIAVTYYESSDIALVDATTRAVQYILHTPSQVAPALGVTDFAWSPDGRFLASAFEDEIINIWDLASDTPPQPLVIHYTGRVPTLSWSPNNDKLATAWGIEDRQIIIWDAHTGAIIRTLEDSTDRFKWVLWSPDDRFLITDSWDGQLELWDSHTYQLMRVLPIVEFERTTRRQVVFNPDGSILLGTDCSGTSDGCTLWQLDMAQFKMLPSFHCPVSSYITQTPGWSADGNFLAVSDESNRTVYVWDAKTTALIRTLTGFKTTVDSPSWSSDHDQFVTVDGTLQTWSILDYF